jgi:hypothetical protein
MTKTEVKVENGCVTILRHYSPVEFAAYRLTFSEVAQASRVLREHLTSVLPAEEPLPTVRPITSRPWCGDPSCVACMTAPPRDDS